jgi:putative transposase
MQDEFDWRKGRTAVFKCFYHLVLTPKYRRDVFTLNMINALKPLIKETCEQMGGELLEFGAEDNHLHLMVMIPPKVAVSNFVGKLKGKSAYFLRKEHWDEVKYKLWGKHFWSPSYCVVTCGGAPLDVIKAYVENQEKPQK